MQFWAWNWMPPLGGFWWIFPLGGLALMVLMAFVCMRMGAMSQLGCVGGRATDRSRETEGLRREVQELKEEIRSLDDRR